MEHATNYHIMDTHINNTRQQKVQIYHVFNASELLNQGKCLTKDRVQQKFPHIMEEVNVMGNIAS